jgi:hypothetical protein
VPRCVIEGRVDATENLGYEGDVVLALDGTNGRVAPSHWDSGTGGLFTARLDGARHLAPGDPVRLTFLPGRLCVFDAETGRSLRPPPAPHR